MAAERSSIVLERKQKFGAVLWGLYKSKSTHGDGRITGFTVKDVIDGYGQEAIKSREYCIHYVTLSRCQDIATRADRTSLSNHVLFLQVEP